MKDKKIVHLPVEQYLNDKEHAAYMEDFTPVMNDLIDKLVAIADKHNVDRDNAIQHFAAVFNAMTNMATFKDWEAKEQYQCSICGEQYTTDEIQEITDMGELFYDRDGKWVCPSCYDTYIRNSDGPLNWEREDTKADGCRYDDHECQDYMAGLCKIAFDLNRGIPNYDWCPHRR